MALRFSHSDKNVYDWQCGCPRPERPEYHASADEVGRLRRWFAEHWAPVSEDFARFALTSVAEVANGSVASASFEGKDGAVATITRDVARHIIRKDA